MEGFSNWDREEPSEPFTVMLFKGLQVVAFMFFLAYLAINTDAKQGTVDTKAEMLVTVSWPDNHPDDIDLYAEDPLGNIVWYHVREGGFMVLDRDDRGSANNTLTVDGRKVTSPFRQETISIRGIVAGEYTVNVHYFLATKGGPVPTLVKVEKINPQVEVVSHDTVMLNRMGEEKTAVRFRLAASGSVVETNHRDKSLIQLTRNVRRTGK